MKKIILLLFFLCTLTISSCKKFNSELKKYYYDNAAEIVPVFKAAFGVDSVETNFYSKISLRKNVLYKKWKCYGLVEFIFSYNNQLYATNLAFEFTTEADAKSFMNFTNGVEGFPLYKMRGNIVYMDCSFMYFFFDDYKIVQDLYLVSKDETTFIGIKDSIKTAKIDVVLPDTITSITGFAFKPRNENSNYIGKINKLICNKNLKSIGMGALYAFNKIEEISLNDGLENIGQGAFDNGNNSYVDIVIPSSVKKIAKNAFFKYNIFVDANKGTQLWDNKIAISQNSNIYFKEEWEYDENRLPVLKFNNNESSLEYCYYNNIEKVKQIYQALTDSPIVTTKYYKKDDLAYTEFYKYNCVASISFQYLKEIQSVKEYSVWEFSNPLDATEFLEYMNNKAGFKKYKLENLIVYEDIVPMYYLLNNYKDVDDYMILSKDEKTFIGIKEGSDVSNLNIVLPNSVESIAGYAFKSISLNSFNIRVIDRIVFSENLKTIGPYAFDRIYISKQIILNNGLESIAEGAFNLIDKSSYADILLPLTVKYIGDKAFNYCNIFVNTSKDNPLWNSESCFKEDIRIYYKDEWRINQSGQLIVTTKNE